MSSLTTINAGDQPKNSRSVINSNFSALNTDKVENGANVGTGEGSVFKDKSSTNLRFKKIKAGSNITVTDNGSEIQIDANASNSDASTSTKGLTKLSVAPASPTNPIAAGTNDPRIPTQDENDALLGTSGTPGSGNKFVTNDDPRLAAANPVGAIIPYAAATAPTGYLLCDGSAVSRSAYVSLFALIGTTYGAGDGSTTFNLPNLKGKGPVGFDSSQTEFDTLGETGGEKTHILTASEMPAHTHATPGIGSSSGVTSRFAFGSSGGTTDLNTTSAGSDQPHNNLQPYITLQFIIKT